MPVQGTTHPSFRMSVTTRLTMQHYVPEDRNIKQCHCENLAHVQFYSTHTSNEFDRESGVSFVQVHVPSWLYRAELREQVHPM